MVLFVLARWWDFCAGWRRLRWILHVLRDFFLAQIAFLPSRTDFACGA
jgi:hypothetical protein